MEITLVTNLAGAIALGAASGLNPWIPLLGLSIAQRVGLVELSSSFEWLGRTPTLGVLAVLFLADLIGDKIAAIDSVLHFVGLAVAPASGAIVLAAQENLISNSHPVLAGLLGVILAGTIHSTRGAIRPIVTATTAGAGNPVVSVIEDVVSGFVTLLAVIVPVLAFITVLGVAIWSTVAFRRWRRKRVGADQQAPTPGVS